VQAMLEAGSIQQATRAMTGVFKSLTE